VQNRQQMRKAKQRRDRLNKRFNALGVDYKDDRNGDNKSKSNNRNNYDHTNSNYINANNGKNGWDYRLP